MYAYFTYENGGNPWMSTSNKGFWHMVTKYELSQVGETCFHVVEELPRRPHTYRENQDCLRDFAIAWQNNFADFAYSWGDLADYAGFFEDYGRKYGLLREFHENGIC